MGGDAPPARFEVRVGYKERREGRPACKWTVAKSGAGAG
jgi:hypothetical protein